MAAKNILSNIIIFSVGAIIGSAVTYKFVEEKIKSEALDEIDSVREYYESIATVEDESEEYDSEPEQNYNEASTDKTEYNKIIRESDYYEHNREEDEDMDKPYVIPPEEFGECDYATVSLTYYADGIVANDRDKIIRNVDELIGEESLEHFGEYEEDSVFVRNDRLRIDYEILKDYRNYSEIS